MNCSCGTCSGLVIWRPRCTADALSRTRHVIPNPLPLLIASAVILLNGSVNPMMHALSMTPVSVLALVPFPQLSPHVCSYCPITPSLCALGQQVITPLISSYCSVTSRSIRDPLLLLLPSPKWHSRLYVGTQPRVTYLCNLSAVLYGAAP